MKTTIALIIAGLATIAINASADPIVRTSPNGTRVIILDPVVVIVPRPPTCSAPRPLASGPTARTVRVCEAGAL